MTDERSSHEIEKWLSFSDAVDAIYTKFGSSYHAANALREKAIAGTIEMVAGGAVYSTDVDYYGQGVVVERYRDWTIPADVWLGVKAFNNLSRPWTTSGFTAISGGLGAQHSYVLSDVRMKAEPIEAMVATMQDRSLEAGEEMARGLGVWGAISNAASVPAPSIATPGFISEHAPQVASSPPAPVGSPGKVERWHQFWLAVLEMLNDGDLDRFDTQAELRASLLARIGETLSEDSIRPQVRKIWHGILKRG